MADTFKSLLGTTRSNVILEDLKRVLTSLEEASKKHQKKSGSKSKERGRDIEKKAREKRRARAGKGDGGGAKMNPFKRKEKLGPGPRDGHNKRTRKWKCKCSKYRCICKSGNRTKPIIIKPDYKKTYNHEYKAWRKNQKF